MRDPKIEAWLKRLLVDFTYADDVQISTINFSENSRNAKQVRFNLIDPSSYESMMTSRKNGEEMPAVLLNKVGNELFMLDGNHRLQTAIDSNMESHDAYIVSVEPDSTIELQLMLEPQTKLASKPLTNEERTRWAIFLAENSKYKQIQIAEITGLTKGQVSNALRYHNAYIRASRLLSKDKQLWNSWDKLAPSYQATLDRIPSDVGWKAAVVAITEHKLSSGQISELVNEVRKCGTDAEYVARVEEYIENLRSTKNVKRNPTEKRAWEYLKMHAAAINGVDVKRIEREMMSGTLDERQLTSLLACLQESADIISKSLDVVAAHKKTSNNIITKTARRATTRR